MNYSNLLLSASLSSAINVYEFLIVGGVPLREYSSRFSRLLKCSPKSSAEISGKLRLKVSDMKLLK